MIDQAFKHIPIPRDLEQAVIRRRVEFVLGRYAAMLSLRSLGAECLVERLQDGAPKWPIGVVGSITHSAGVVAAVVALNADYWGIGIDIERLFTRRVAAEVESVINDRRTQNALMATSSSVSREVALSLVFSAKETAFKAFYPQLRRCVEIEAVRFTEFQFISPSRGIFVAQLERRKGQDKSGACEGNFAVADGHVQTIGVCRERLDGTARNQ